MTLSTGKHKRRYNTFIRCEECSILERKDDYFCNTQTVGHVEGDKGERNTYLYHLAYHMNYYRNDGQLPKLNNDW